jgi:hypothetical protein
MKRQEVVGRVVGIAFGLWLALGSPAQVFSQPPTRPSAEEPQTPADRLRTRKPDPGPEDGRPPAPAVPAAPVVPIKAQNRMAIRDRWGVEIDGVQITAGGYMLNFRYKVVDAEKAAPLFVRKTKPVLTDEKSGANMQVPVGPTTGAMRSSNTPQEGRLYFMFFANPGRYLQKYDMVTVTIGEFSVSNIVVK